MPMKDGSRTENATYNVIAFRPMEPRGDCSRHAESLQRYKIWRNAAQRCATIMITFFQLLLA